MREDLARWQFAFTSVNHFLFIPITIGLAFLTALLQTVWYRRKNPEYLRLTRFFGTLLVINVAIGVVTGLVQEFQFGMNWSAYSRLVGNVFGAPLAMEGLAAFFLESTFLGLWLFGWDKLSRRVHLATIWLVAIGSALSAAVIMAANSWMQHPVGFVTVNGKPQLNDIWALFTNPVWVWSYAKVIFAALVTGAAVMLAVSAWQLRRGGDRLALPAAARRGQSHQLNVQLLMRLPAPGFVNSSPEPILVGHGHIGPQQLHWLALERVHDCVDVGVRAQQDHGRRARPQVTLDCGEHRAIDGGALKLAHHGGNLAAFLRHVLPHGGLWCVLRPPQHGDVHHIDEVLASQLFELDDRIVGPLGPCEPPRRRWHRSSSPPRS